MKVDKTVCIMTIPIVSFRQEGVTLIANIMGKATQKKNSPVVGATKFHHIEGVVKAVDLESTGDQKINDEESADHPVDGRSAQTRTERR